MDNLEDEVQNGLLVETGWRREQLLANQGRNNERSRLSGRREGSYTLSLNKREIRYCLIGRGAKRARINSHSPRNQVALSAKPPIRCRPQQVGNSSFSCRCHCSHLAKTLHRLCFELTCCLLGACNRSLSRQRSSIQLENRRPGKQDMIISIYSLSEI